MKKYRLLIHGEIIMEGDEILNDDCETWDAEWYKKPGQFFIGYGYDAGMMVPHRRIVESEEHK